MERSDANLVMSERNPSVMSESSTLLIRAVALGSAL